MEDKETNKNESIQKLIDLGTSKGSLTYEQIMNGLDGIDLDPEQIEKLYETFEAKGIEIIDDFDEDFSDEPNPDDSLDFDDYSEDEYYEDDDKTARAELNKNTVDFVDKGRI